MFCIDCDKGGYTRLIVGDGIHEPPYITVVKCPYNNEYYKDIDDECDCEDKI